MEWLKIFTEPAYMLAALCIVILASIVHMMGKMLLSRDELQAKLATEMAEGNKLAQRMAALLDMLCSKWLSGGGGPRT